MSRPTHGPLWSTALVLIVAVLLLPGVLAVVSEVPAALSPSSPQSVPIAGPGGITPAIAPGRSAGTSCANVALCTTSALTSITGGDTLIAVVAAYDDGAGNPSSVTEVTGS